MAFCYSLGNRECNFYYVTVKNEDAEAHINSERDYFSKMHKASIWDMWRLENPNYESHTQHLYMRILNH